MSERPWQMEPNEILSDLKFVEVKSKTMTYKRGVSVVRGFVDMQLKQLKPHIAMHDGLWHLEAYRSTHLTRRHFEALDHVRILNIRIVTEDRAKYGVGTRFPARRIMSRAHNLRGFALIWYLD